MLTFSGVVFSYAKLKVGEKGLDSILEDYSALGQDGLERAEMLIDKYGSATLLITDIPGIDTIVTMVSGGIGVGTGRFYYGSPSPNLSGSSSSRYSWPT